MDCAHPAFSPPSSLHPTHLCRAVGSTLRCHPAWVKASAHVGLPTPPQPPPWAPSRKRGNPQPLPQERWSHPTMHYFRSLLVQRHVPPNARASHLDPSSLLNCMTQDFLLTHHSDVERTPTSTWPNCIMDSKVPQGTLLLAPPLVCLVRACGLLRKKRVTLLAVTPNARSRKRVPTILPLSTALALSPSTSPCQMTSRRRKWCTMKVTLKMTLSTWKKQMQMLMLFQRSGEPSPHLSGGALRPSLL